MERVVVLRGHDDELRLVDRTEGRLLRTAVGDSGKESLGTTAVATLRLPMSWARVRANAWLACTTSKLAVLPAGWLTTRVAVAA